MKIFSTYSEKKKSDIVATLGTIFLLIVVVYMTSGYFKYYAISIGTGSMYPTIKIGDALVVEKLTDKKELKKGDIAVFKYHGVTIVHRVVKVVEEKDENYYYTKGDDNENNDNYVVYEDMIVGKVVFKVPFLGLPAVWLNRTGVNEV